MIFELGRLLLTTTSEIISKNDERIEYEKNSLSDAFITNGRNLDTMKTLEPTYVSVSYEQLNNNSLKPNSVFIFIFVAVAILISFLCCFRQMYVLCTPFPGDTHAAYDNFFVTLVLTQLQRLETILYLHLL